MNKTMTNKNDYEHDDDDEHDDGDENDEQKRLRKNTYRLNEKTNS